MKTIHIVRFVIKSADGKVKKDDSFTNFAFTNAYDLFADYFEGNALPTALYLSLLANVSNGPFSIGHALYASHSTDWAENTVEFDTISPGDTHIPRQLWEPSLTAWDDGVDEYGYELSGSVQWTASGFTNGNWPARFVTHVKQGILLYADEDFLDFNPDDPFADNTAPVLFGAVGPDSYSTDYLGAGGDIEVGDAIDVTYTIRFQVEETGV